VNGDAGLSSAVGIELFGGATISCDELVDHDCYDFVLAVSGTLTWYGGSIINGQIIFGSSASSFAKGTQLSPECTEVLLQPSQVLAVTEFDEIKQEIIQLTDGQCWAPAHDVLIEFNKILVFDLEYSFDAMRFTIPAGLVWQNIRTLTLKEVNEDIAA
jgi:hypothetical protein